MKPPSVVVSCTGCGELGRFVLTPFRPQHGLVREIISRHKARDRCRGPIQVLTSGKEVVSWWEVELEHVAHTRTDDADRVADVVAA